MMYVSTRGEAAPRDFEGVLLAGLAEDGGLFVPESWPVLTTAEWRKLRGLPYPELAARILALFTGGQPNEATLRPLLQQAYAGFGHNAVCPLVQIDQRTFALELFHGPTLAFKDMAMQALGLLFDTTLARRGERVTIVGATSGDTGSAAIDAVAGRENLSIVMLHPAGRVSDVQRRQMTTVIADNVHNVAIDGSFDDAQAMVKRMFGDPDVTGHLTLSAVNSINWARLAAQVVYYFYAAVRLGAPHCPVAFSVPTGNFGDVFAGYVAARMGLPVARLVVATNVNDILHRALAQGDYSAGIVTPTATPSMDIQVSSNFERLLFDLGGRDGAAMAAQMAGFESTRAMRLTNAQREGASALFTSAAIDGPAMAGALRWAWESAGELIDPHTAIGLAAARADDGDPAIPMVTLATAHPAKFGDAVERASGRRPVLPGRVGNLFDREERYVSLPGDYAAVRDFVLRHGGA